MANLMDYLTWRGDISMACSEFNEVDAMILSAFSYMPFEELEKDELYNKSIGEVCESLLKLQNLNDKVLLKADIPLLEALLVSERFKNIQIIDYENNIDLKKECQFSAIALKPDKKQICIAFKGTDDTIIGWKEDFNMSFESPVPSQLMGIKFFEKIAKTHYGKFIFTGHSKGGNLAVYAGAFSKPLYTRRIEKIYNFDSPGFDEKVINSSEYEKVCTITETFIPQSSVVGMLLGHKEEYKVVESARNIGILQHDIFSWCVMGPRLVYLDSVTEESKFIDASLKEWIQKLDYSQKRQLVDTVYLILSKTNMQTVKDLKENWFENAKSILKSIKNLDDDTQKAVTGTLSILFDVAKTNLIRMKEEKRKEEEK